MSIASFEWMPPAGGKGSRQGKRKKESDEHSAVSDFLNRLKGKKPPTSGFPGAWELADLASEMHKLGLQPAGLERFIVSLHRLAVASGIDPKALASFIRELDILSGGNKISIEKIRAEIHELFEEHKDLVGKISELQSKKTALEADLDEKVRKNKDDRDSLAPYLQLKQELENAGISTKDLARLTAMIISARELGYDRTELTKLLEDLKAAREKKAGAEAELEELLDSKRSAQQRILAIDQDVAEKQALLESARDLEKMGFEPGTLLELSGMIRMITNTRKIDESEARQRLLDDIRSYYANDQELAKRIRTLEALLREKEEKFRMLEADLRNEKAVLENASRLIASGLDERWLLGIQKILDSYGMDLDTLAGELQERKGLAERIQELAKTKQALEDEEKVLRQKVVAAEDQRLRTLSLINSIMVRAARPEERMDASLQEAASHDFIGSAQNAIQTIRSRLPADSPARLVLEHALLALKLESDRR